MIKIEIKNRFTGSIIFEYSKENNTIKDTLKEYISQELKKGNRSADLTYANLTSANLTSAKNKENATLPMFCKWSHGIKGGKIKIGCKEKTIEEWDLFFNSDGVIETERNTQDFKQIQAVYLSYKAYLTHLNS